MHPSGWGSDSDEDIPDTIADRTEVSFHFVPTEKLSEIDELRELINSLRWELSQARGNEDVLTKELRRLRIEYDRGIIQHTNSILKVCNTEDSFLPSKEYSGDSVSEINRLRNLLNTSHEEKRHLKESANKDLCDIKYQLNRDTLEKHNFETKCRLLELSNNQTSAENHSLRAELDNIKTANTLHQSQAYAAMKANRETSLKEKNELREEISKLQHQIIAIQNSHKESQDEMKTQSHEMGEKLKEKEKEIEDQFTAYRSLRMKMETNSTIMSHVLETLQTVLLIEPSMEDEKYIAQYVVKSVIQLQNELKTETRRREVTEHNFDLGQKKIEKSAAKIQTLEFHVKQFSDVLQDSLSPTEYDSWWRNLKTLEAINATSKKNISKSPPEKHSCIEKNKKVDVLKQMKPHNTTSSYHWSSMINVQGNRTKGSKLPHVILKN